MAWEPVPIPIRRYASPRRLSRIAAMTAPSAPPPAPAPTASGTPARAWALAHVWMPVLMVPALGGLLAVRAHREPSGWAMALFTLSALAVYTGDRLGDGDGEDSAAVCLRPWRRWLMVVAALAALGCGLLALLHWRALGETACFLAALSLAYPLLRLVPAGKTIAVTVAWTWALHVVAAAPAWTHIDAVIGILIAATTVGCDLKDVAQDRVGGVRSLPAALGAGMTRTLAAAACLAAMALAWSASAPWLAATAGLQVVPLALPMTARPVLGPLLIDGLLVLVPAIGCAFIR